MGIIENGNYIEVHPTFLYESVGCLIIFILLFVNKNNRKYNGQLTYTFLAVYGCLRTFIEGLRTDSLMVNNFRISQVLSIILCVVFSTVLVYKKVKKDKKYEK